MIRVHLFGPDSIWIALGMCAFMWCTVGLWTVPNLYESPHLQDFDCRQVSEEFRADCFEHHSKTPLERNWPGVCVLAAPHAWLAACVWSRCASGRAGPNREVA